MININIIVNNHLLIEINNKEHYSIIRIELK